MEIKKILYILIILLVISFLGILISVYLTQTLKNKNTYKYISNFWQNDLEDDPNITQCYYSIEKKENYTNKIDLNVIDFYKIESSLSLKGIRLLDGGKSYTELNNKCVTNTTFKKIAFIIPYRNRLSNLKVFLNNMHSFLVKQKINYGIYLIEPVEGIIFNRGLLMNIGFIESIRDKTKLKNIPLNKSLDELNTYWDCWVFHDVDMIPEDERMIYGCNDKMPMHLALKTKKLLYEYVYDYVGGIVAFTREQYRRINGMSNLFFGWGGEDDNLKVRLLLVYEDIARPSENVSRFYTDQHQDDIPNPDRKRIIKILKDLAFDNRTIPEGLNTTSYVVNLVEKKPLFTRIFVNYDKKFYLQNNLFTTTVKP